MTKKKRTTDKDVYFGSGLKNFEAINPMAETIQGFSDSFYRCQLDLITLCVCIIFFSMRKWIFIQYWGKLYHNWHFVTEPSSHMGLGPKSTARVVSTGALQKRRLGPWPLCLQDPKDIKKTDENYLFGLTMKKVSPPSYTKF